MLDFAMKVSQANCAPRRLFLDRLGERSPAPLDQFAKGFFALIEHRL
jgi:hypothetical protein